MLTPSSQNREGMSGKASWSPLSMQTSPPGLRSGSWRAVYVGLQMLRTFPHPRRAEQFRVTRSFNTSIFVALPAGLILGRCDLRA